MNTLTDKSVPDSIYIFYHANCLDGYTAAWAAHQNAYLFFPENATILYGPLQYSSSLKEDILEYLPVPEYKGNFEIYFLDFSISPEFADELSANFPNLSKLVILDHHESARREWEGKEPNPKHTVIFNNNWSGAALSYLYFSGEEIPEDYTNKIYIPQIVKYVQDWDLWKFRHGDATRNVNKWLGTIARTFADWSFADRRLNDDLVTAMAIGAGINHYAKNIRTSLIKQSLTPCNIFHPSGGVAVNAPHAFASDLGHEILEKFPEYPYVAIWSVSTIGEVIVSLRSKGEVDVSVLAKQKGGGGHKNAAGFTMDFQTFWNELTGVQPCLI